MNLPPELATSRQWRLALATHDAQSIFRLLTGGGLSQRKIAAIVGISQSEVSEIMSGRRALTSYTVLERFCLGLGATRGSMGLAYDPATWALLTDARSTHPDPARVEQAAAHLTRAERFVLEIVLMAGTDTGRLAALRAYAGRLKPRELHRVRRVVETLTRNVRRPTDAS